MMNKRKLLDSLIKKNIYEINHIPEKKILEMLNKKVVITQRWKHKLNQTDKYFDKINRMISNLYNKNILEYNIKYSYFKAHKKSNTLKIIVNNDKYSLYFPRQNKEKKLSIIDFFKNIDYILLYSITIGRKITAYINKLYKDGKYQKYFYYSGIASEIVESSANYLNYSIKNQLNYNDGMFKRYSFGYSSCPDLKEQKKVLSLLKVNKITLTSSNQLKPEFSTTGFYIFNKDAVYLQI